MFLCHIGVMLWAPIKAKCNVVKSRNLRCERELRTRSDFDLVYTLRYNVPYITCILLWARYFITQELDFTIYYLLYTTAVPSGLFVPGILMGCSYGRWMGEILRIWFPSADINPGTYAVIGTCMQCVCICIHTHTQTHTLTHTQIYTPTYTPNI